MSFHSFQSHFGCCVTFLSTALINVRKTSFYTKRNLRLNLEIPEEVKYLFSQFTDAYYLMPVEANGTNVTENIKNWVIKNIFVLQIHS